MKGDKQKFQLNVNYLAANYSARVLVQSFLRVQSKTFRPINNQLLVPVVSKRIGYHTNPVGKNVL